MNSSFFLSFFWGGGGGEDWSLSCHLLCSKSTSRIKDHPRAKVIILYGIGKTHYLLQLLHCRNGIGRTFGETKPEDHLIQESWPGLSLSKAFHGTTGIVLYSTNKKKYVSLTSVLPPSLVLVRFI